MTEATHRKFFVCVAAGVNPDAFNPLTPGSGVAFTPRRGFPDASSSQPRVPISSQGLSPDKDSDAVRSALACLSPAGGLEEVLEGTLEADGDVEKSESGTMDTNEPDETKEAADTIQRTPAKSVWAFLDSVFVFAV